HVIRESSRNPDLLFVGTENALFVTLDGGKVWHHLKAGLPKVPIHDLVIHPRDRDLVIATHGRSIYVMDISALEELTPAGLAKDAHLFSVRPAQAFTPTEPEMKSKAYVAGNPPVGADIYYHLKAPAKEVSITILDANKPAPGKELKIDTFGRRMSRLA